MLRRVQLVFKNPVLTPGKKKTNISWLVLFREIITVFSGYHMKPINTLCGKNAELLNVKAGGMVINVL
jgi:hypothetical protein